MKTKMVLLIGLIVLLTGAAWANDPKDYIAAPPGTKAVLFYYNHTSGNEAFFNGNEVGHDSNLTTNVGMFRMVYFGKIGSWTWACNAILPVGQLTLDGADVGGVEMSNTQMGDPVLAAGLWLVDDAASRTWLAFSQYVTPPLGEYDNANPLNMGSNRWTFREELGFAKGIGKSNWHFDMSAFVEFYTDNDDLTTASLKLEKDAAWGGDAHISYNIHKDVCISLDYLYLGGGETSINGIDQSDSHSDHTWGLTVTFGLTPNSSLLIKYYNGFKTESGIETDMVGMRFAYFF